MSEYGKQVAKKMSDYPSNIESVDEEVHDIQHAIEGVEVRGALASGVQKAHDVSKDADGKATEAHDVMESIMEEGFDNAALESNFEQKLDDKIENLQPEWTGFKDDVETQLAETERQQFYNSPISHKQPEFMVTIIDDDGHRGFYTKYFELAKEYNIPIVSAMITGKPMGFPWDDRTYNNRYYHYDEIMEMDKSGLIEFVSHSHTHPQPITEVSDENLYEDYKKSKEVLKRLGLNHRALVQPGGNYDKRIFDITRSLFDYGFRGRNNVLEVTVPPVDNIGIHRLSIEQHNFEDKIKTEIDAAKDLNGWLVFVGHVDQDYGWSESKVRQVIEYVQSQGGKFVTTQEGINHHGNTLQAGGISISADGRFFGDGLYKTELEPNTYTATNRVEDFPVGTTTFKVQASQAGEGLPNGRGGTITTVNPSETEPGWSYQIYNQHADKKTYIRSGLASGWWTLWNRVSFDYNYAERNEFDAETKIEEFSKGTTVFTLNASHNDTGLPNGTGGTFTTVKVSNGELGWNYQKFVEYKTSNMYIRYANENGYWASWKKFVVESV